jgi:hypothetical protein
MKIKTVSYSKLFSLGMYMNERVGFEAEIDDTEDEFAALDKLRSIAQQFHTQSNPALYANEVIQYDDKSTSKEEQEKHFIDGVIAAIKSSQNRKSVEWHKATVDKYGEKYPELGIAYRNQLQKFV